MCPKGTFGNTFTSKASRNSACKVRGGPWSFHFHDFVEVETEQVKTFVDTNKLSNMTTPLSRGHGDEDVEKFGHGCIANVPLILLVC